MIESTGSMGRTATYAEELLVAEVTRLKQVFSLAEEGLANYEEENQAAVALIRALVAYGHEPLPADLVQRAGLFLERYPYEQQVPQSEQRSTTEESK